MSNLLQRMQTIPYGKGANERTLGVFLSRNWDDFTSLIHRNKTLERQNTDLQAANTKRTLENRELKAELALLQDDPTYTPERWSHINPDDYAPGIDLEPGGVNAEINGRPHYKKRK